VFATLSPPVAVSSLPRRERGLAAESYDVAISSILRSLLGRELPE